MFLLLLYGNRSVPLLIKEGLGEVLLEIRLLNPHFTKGDLNGYVVWITALVKEVTIIIFTV